MSDMPLGFLVGGLLVGGGLVAQSVHALVRWRTARRWPSTAGVVLESSVHGASDGYLNTVAASVRYSYRVNGQEYESNRVHYAGFGAQTEALTTRDAYPPGMPVTVFFDPARPSRAVLEHDPPLFPYLLLPMGLAILAFVVLQALGSQG